MSKYKTKQQLLDEITKEKGILDKVLSSVSVELMGNPGVCEDWSVKDVICHLAEWQLMVISWFEAGSRGEMPAVPSVDYKWSQLPELNESIYKKYNNYSTQAAIDLFTETEKKIMKLINEIDEKTLLVPGLQPWMNKNTLIAYFGSCTSSHYKWASGLIRKLNYNH